MPGWVQARGVLSWFAGTHPSWGKLVYLKGTSIYAEAACRQRLGDARYWILFPLPSGLTTG
jgi:hypothetical protein